MIGQESNLAAKKGWEKKPPLASLPYLWDPDVRLPEGPPLAEVEKVRYSMQVLGQQCMDADRGGKFSTRTCGERELADFLQTRRPMYKGEEEPELPFPPIIYFLYNPVLFLDERTRIRMQVRLDGMEQKMNAFHHWQAFWKEAEQALSLWLACQNELREADERVQRWWPELPGDMIRRYVLAHQGNLWLDYARACLMRSRSEGLQKHDLKVITLEDWEPIQFMGEWGIGFLRAWHAGFFDVKWYHVLEHEKSMSREHLVACMQVEGRYLRGRYLLLYDKPDWRHPHPTYQKEYMQI